MENFETTLGDYLNAVKRRRKQLLTVIGVLLVVTLGVGFGLPPIYQSKATILIEQQEIPQDLVKSTVTSFADERIQVISQRVMTTANLNGIIQKFNLYQKERKDEPLEQVIDGMRKDINLNMVSAQVVNPRNGEPQDATIAFTISYKNRSPELAQRVANELVSLYLNENVKSRNESAKSTSTFLTDEAAKLKAHVDELDAKLAAFKEKNVDSLPDMMTFNLDSLESARRELQDTENQVKADRQRQIYLESQLAQTQPNSNLYSETGERILSPEDRLKNLESKYITLKAKYSPDYPDVVSMKKEIDALKQTLNAGESRADLEARLQGYRADLAAARKKFTENHPDVKKLERLVSELRQKLKDLPPEKPKAVAENPDNPAYIQLKANLDASRNDLEVLTKRREQLEQKISKFEERVARAPQVEKRYLELTRDDQVAQAQYNELLAKRMSAQVSQTMETERMGERFSLIEPPQLPEKPFEPNRLAIFLAGSLFSFVAGIGSVALSESLDTTIRGRKALTRLLQVPPLATIPVIMTEKDRRQKFFRRAMVFILLVIAIVGALFVINYFYRPLDVLWATALERIGMK